MDLVQWVSALWLASTPRGLGKINYSSGRDSIGLRQREITGADYQYQLGGNDNGRWSLSLNGRINGRGRRCHSASDGPTVIGFSQSTSVIGMRMLRAEDQHGLSRTFVLYKEWG